MEPEKKGKNKQFTVELNYHVGSALVFFSQPNLQHRMKLEAPIGAVGQMVERIPHCLLQSCPPWWQHYWD